MSLGFRSLFSVICNQQSIVCLCLSLGQDNEGCGKAVNVAPELRNFQSIQGTQANG